MSADYDGVLGPLRLVRRFSCISVVSEVTHEASQGPLKGPVSSQKAETRELQGGTEVKSFSQTRVINVPSRQINLLQKGNKKIELLARPGFYVSVYTVNS